MIDFPVDFFYEQEVEGHLFTRHSTGRLAMSQIFRGRQDYWREHRSIKTRRKKTLLLNDWTLHGKDSLQQKMLLLDLLRAEEPRFEILIWQDGSIQTLTADNLEHYFEKEQLKKITSATKELIDKALIEKGKNPLHCVYLDNYQFARLHTSSDQSYFIKTSDFPKDTDKEDIIATALTFYPHVTIVSDDVNLEKSDSLSEYKKIKKAFKEVDIVNEFFRMECLSFSDENEIIAHPVFSSGNLTRLKYLSISNLKFLSMDGQEKLFCFLGARYPQLEEVSFSNSNIASKGIAALLQSCSKLRKLNFFERSKLEGILNLEQVDLEYLEELNLRGIEISTENLEALLKKSLNLRKINLGDGEIFGEKTLNLKHVNLEQLQELNLSSRRCYAEELKELLAICPNLRKLNLHYATLHEKLFLEDVNLEQLQELELSSSKLTGENLEMLLSKCPNLRRLHLAGAGLLQTPHLDDINLAQLQVLTLSKSTFSPEGLKTFLAKCPNLKKLYLLDYAFPEILLSEEVNLSQLEMLDMRFSPISSKYLETLLQKHPYLQELDLEGCNNLLEKMNLERVNLTHLRKLTLSNMYMHNEAIVALLERIPNLHVLKFGQSNVREKINFENVNLTQLQELDLTSSKINKENLIALLQRCSGLKKLTVLESHRRWIHESEALKAYRHLVPAPQAEEYPQSPEHNPKDEYNNMAPPEEFTYRGNHNNLSQNMVIEKLCQYLTLTNQHRALIPEIQVGICEVLSRLFQRNPARLHQVLKVIKKWNGKHEFLTEDQKDIFENLLKEVREKHKIDTDLTTYLGDFTKGFLESCKDSYILVNPWHAISIHYNAQENSWLVYDPNHPAGPQTASTTEELYEFVKKSLGNLVSVRWKTTVSPALVITDINQFLAEGGFLMLARNEHSRLLCHIGPQDYIDDDGLTGLMIRNNYGVPAWILGLRNPLTKGFFLYFIQQYIHKNNSFFDDFKKSLSALPKEEQEAYLELIAIAAGQEKKSLVDGLNEISSREKNVKIISDLTEKFRSLFPLESNPAPNHDSWLFSLLQQEGQKTLIRTHGENHHQDCLMAVYQQAKNENRNVFFINSPEDLDFSSPWIQKDKNNRGLMQKAPGGPLYDFLHDIHINNPILLINYANFKPQDIIQLNSLLDDARKIGVVKVPDSFSIIGVQDTQHPDYYSGTDFSSRFDNKEFYIPAENISLEEIVTVEDSTTPYPIDLFHAMDWEERLLGSWVLSGQQLQFVEGELTKALQSKRPIVIHNGPENNANYRLFWKKLAIDGEINGVKVDVRTIYHSQGYDWDDLCGPHTFHSVSSGVFQSKQTFLLNSDSKNTLFAHVICDSEKEEISQQKGLLSQSKHRTLRLLVTENLSQDQWAEILHEANQNEVALDLQLLPGILPPEAILETYEQEAEVEDAYSRVFIHSTDADVTVSQIKKEYWKEEEKIHVIDVSEMDANDLIIQWDAHFNEDTNHFRFKKNTQYLLKCLEKDKDTRFILKGSFKQSLLNALLPLVRQYPHRLILITEDKKTFAPFGASPHEVSFDEKIECLNDYHLDSFNEKTLSTYSLSQLQALNTYQETHPGNTDIRAPWKGFYSLNGAINNTSEFNPLVAEEETRRFFEERFDDLCEALVTAPTVFIGGLTGVGKSTFIEKHFKPRINAEVYIGEKSLKNWAFNEKGGYLFLDEANISQRNWSEFEGIYNCPPTILIDGELKELSPNHKVIFAGNPLNYGGSRHEASLFKRHGNSVIFKPLPANVIYQEILKPLFANTELQAEIETLSQHLLQAYNLLIQLSHDKILVTPRQLKSVVMLTLAECERNSEIVPQDSLVKHIRDILRPLVGKKNYRVFDEIFPGTLFQENNVESMEGFLVTASRRQAIDLITSFLNVREFKQRNASSLNDTHLYGDLNSIVLESMPGLGKTEMLKALLKASGIQEGDIHSSDLQTNVFYSLPVNLSFTEKERLLRKAFDEGNIVVMDEINSSPMLEKLLNALLSGHTPEGHRPTKPGFLLLGTQNPAAMGARLLETQAQDKRMAKCTLIEYPEKEIQEILCFKELPENHAVAMARAFQQQRKAALLRKVTPPNFRDLLREADKVIAHLEQSREKPERISGSQHLFLKHPKSELPQPSLVRRKLNFGMKGS